MPNAYYVIRFYKKVIDMGETVFTNGRLIVSFKPVKVEDSMLVRDGIIVAIGGRDEVTREATGNAEEVDLKGRTVMPGFIDAHMHLDNLGEYLDEIDLVGVSSIGELQSKIRGSHGIMGWVLGHGWDEHRFREHRMPTRSDIEEAEMERPVYLSRVDLHSAVLNSKAIDILELRDRFHRSENLENAGGELTGIVRENVFEYVDRAIKEKCTEDESCTMLTDAMDEALRNGITSVGFVSCSLGALNFLKRLRDEGRIKLRVNVYINADEIDNFKGFENDEMLRVVGVKMFADGSLGTKSAHLSFSYLDDPGNRGMEITGSREMLEIGKRAEKMGLHIATHAIGDRALDSVIEVYKNLKGKHRIDHVSLIRNDQIQELKNIPVFLVVQPHFVITDFWTLDRIGKKRANMAYPFGTLLNSGFEMALSTDCPVEPINPWETVYAAITRGKEDGIPLGMATEDEAIGLEDALNLYTEGSARSILDESSGKLAKGMNADFIVVDRDPFSETPGGIRNIHTMETYVGGLRVFEVE